MKKEELKEIIRQELQSFVNEGKTRWKARVLVTGENGPRHMVDLYYEKNSKPSKADPFWKRELFKRWKNDGNSFLSLGARKRLGKIKSFDVEHIYDSSADNAMGDIYSKKRKGGGYGYAGD
jgi:hypothetical protein